MSKEMVISANPHETRVAIMEEGQLCEYYVEREKEFALVGSIYKGRVTRVLPGMQSAFVEIGLDSDAFLYVTRFPRRNRRTRPRSSPPSTKRSTRWRSRAAQRVCSAEAPARAQRSSPPMSSRLPGESHARPRAAVSRARGRSSQSSQPGSSIAAAHPSVSRPARSERRALASTRGRFEQSRPRMVAMLRPQRWRRPRRARTIQPARWTRGGDRRFGRDFRSPSTLRSRPTKIARTSRLRAGRATFRSFCRANLSPNTETSRPQSRASGFGRLTERSYPLSSHEQRRPAAVAQRSSRRTARTDAHESPAPRAVRARRDSREHRSASF